MGIVSFTSTPVSTSTNSSRPKIELSPLCRVASANKACRLTSSVTFTPNPMVTAEKSSPFCLNQTADAVVRGRAVHERDRANCRLSDRSAGDRETCLLAHGHAPDSGQLHEQVVRMLMVDQWPAIERLPHLEDFPIAPFADGRRIEAEHGVD